MAYDTGMTTISDSDLVDADMWNTLVNNIDFLHDRQFTISVVPNSNTDPTLQGDWVAPQTNNVQASTHTHFAVAIPDHWGTLISAEVTLMTTSSYTAEYDVNTDFGANGENYNNHSGSILNQTVALTANQLKEIDISAALSGLAGGDYLSVRVSNSTGANAGNWMALVMKLVYTPSDSVA